jgi:sugar phosphate isomerase/epimerase
MTTGTDTGIELIASCWTTAGDAEPYAGQGENREASPIDVLTRIEKAAAGGWKGFGLVHADIVRARETTGLDEVRAALQEHGLRHVQVEFLNDWWTSGALRTASDSVRRDLLEAAQALGASEIKVAGNYSWGAPVPEDIMAEAFWDLSEQAAEAGTRIALEPLPFSNFQTIEHGADFVRRVGHPNGGLVVDIWHVYRGHTPIDDLPKILHPGMVFAVELNDAALADPDDMWVDTVHRRRLCGEGEWDVPGFINSMRDCGYAGAWGVEILSESFRKLPLDTALPLAYETTMACFEEAERERLAAGGTTA